MLRLKKLSSPAQVQDFINKIPFNHEKKGETYRSVRETLKAGKAHCFEGALVAAALLEQMGQKPMLLDLRVAEGDVDHVVALFKRGDLWGAVSKTNHGVLRFREPVYKNVRELAMSYFHEYFLQNGEKTLREYSKPFDLNKTKHDWREGKGNLSPLVDEIDASPHTKILPKGLKLRKADPIERRMGELEEWRD